MANMYRKMTFKDQKITFKSYIRCSQKSRKYFVCQRQRGYYKNDQNKRINCSWILDYDTDIKYSLDRMNSKTLKGEYEISHMGNTEHRPESIQKTI